VERPRLGSVRVELLLAAVAPLQPVVDRVRRDRRGQRSEVIRRRASDAGELLEAPVRQVRAVSVAHAFVENERVGVLGSHMQSHGFDDPLFGATAPGAGRVEELLNACVALVGWPPGPFPMGGVRIDCRYTLTVHC